MSATRQQSQDSDVIAAGRVSLPALQGKAIGCAAGFGGDRVDAYSTACYVPRAVVQPTVAMM